jgi:hypothetical protein
MVAGSARVPIEWSFVKSFNSSNSVSHHLQHGFNRLISRTYLPALDFWPLRFNINALAKQNAIIEARHEMNLRPLLGGGDGDINRLLRNIALKKIHADLFAYSAQLNRSNDIHITASPSLPFYGVLRSLASLPRWWVSFSASPQPATSKCTMWVVAGLIGRVLMLRVLLWPHPSHPLQQQLLHGVTIDDAGQTPASGVKLW